MKHITASCLIGTLFVFCNCTGTRPLDTQAMLGMRFQTCVTLYDLNQHKSWPTHNVPPGSDQEITYFLPTGNLVIQYDDREKITSTSFEQSKLSAEERLNKFHDGWEKWVDAHTIKEPDQKQERDK